MSVSEASEDEIQELKSDRVSVRSFILAIKCPCLVAGVTVLGPISSEAREPLGGVLFNKDRLCLLARSVAGEDKGLRRLGNDSLATIVGGDLSAGFTEIILDT